MKRKLCEKSVLKYKEMIGPVFTAMSCDPMVHSSPLDNNKVMTMLTVLRTHLKQPLT